MADVVNVKGLRELRAALEQLPLKVERKLMRAAIRAAAVVLREEARARAPVATGKLRRTVRVSSANVKQGKATVNVRAGDRDKKVFYAHMIEFGTGDQYAGTGRRSKRKAYVIKPVGNKALNINGAPKASALHPGTRARPFLGPAFDAKAKDAIDAFAQTIETRLDEVVK
jgi:HK97 gp10 family phage protein